MAQRLARDPTPCDAFLRAPPLMVVFRRSHSLGRHTGWVLGASVLWMGVLLPVEIRAEQLPIKAYTTADGLA